MTNTVIDAIEAVYEAQKAGATTYRLSDVECWCGSPCVLDKQDRPICLELPFHDPAGDPVSR